MAKIPSWQYYFARKFSLQRFEIISRVFYSPFYFKHFKVNLKNILVKPGQSHNYEIWLDRDEYKIAVNRVYKTVCKNYHTYKYYRKIFIQTQLRFLKVAMMVARQTNNRLTNKELGKLYRLFTRHLQKLNSKPIIVVFMIEPLVSSAAVMILTDILKRNSKMNEYDNGLSIIFSPDTKTAVPQMRQALLKIALGVKTGRLNKTKTRYLLNRVVKQYNFLPCYDIIDKPWDYDYFKNELKGILKRTVVELKSELKDMNIVWRQRKNNFKAFLSRYDISQSEEDILRIAHDLVFIKDERDDYRRRGGYYGRRLFAEIGQRLDVDLRAACYLTVDETEGFLFRDIKPSRELLKERQTTYLLLRKLGSPTAVASGGQIKAIIKNEHFLSLDQSKVDEITGVAGSVGMARGSVIIVNTKHDLRRVLPGSIMIAVTTSPDYVPVMRLCKAIVTNEGGITSHAAIVCRELRIPCIVGTKIATRIFKDGDLVEVDTKRGIVRKL
ncbi:MAG: PEP-utilizing enzyme [Patescibacteria group bacterium]